MSAYITYPFKTMNITQSYTGTVSHLPHTTGTPKDWPIDEACADSGRSPMFAPCDLKIIRVYGVGTGGTNTLWVTSTAKVKFANGKEDYISMQITHPNDSDLKRLKVGQIVKKGEILCYEGTDGATGNHIHLSVGMGAIKGNGWVKNSKNKWVLTTANGTVKPEDAFYLDKTFTAVKRSNGITFKDFAETKKAAAAKTATAKYKVTAEVLNCRKEPSLKAARVTRFIKGAVLEVSSTKTADGLKWGKCSKGWIALKYCKKIN